MTDHDEDQSIGSDAGQGSADNADRAEWVAVGTFTTGLEADIARGALEDSGIPVFTKGEQPGIFGGGYGGNISGGIILHVPSPEVERAHQILTVTP